MTGSIFTAKTTLEMTWEDVKEALDNRAAVMLVVGSTEQHGRHLPMGVDTLIPLEICRRAQKNLAKEGVSTIISAPMLFGISQIHMDFPGTVAIKPETLMDSIYDICRSYIDHGFEKIIIIIGHGIAEQEGCCRLAAMKLEQEFEITIALYNWGMAALMYVSRNPEILKSEKPLLDYHAGEMETAMFLSIYPDLVRKENFIRSYTEEHEKSIIERFAVRKGGRKSKTGLRMTVPNLADLSVDSLGHMGDPTVATKETGEVILNFCAQNISDLVKRAEEINEKY